MMDSVQNIVKTERLTPDQTEAIMGFYAFYAVAIVILILHFTGRLRRNNLEWLVLVLAAGTFPPSSS